MFSWILLHFANTCLQWHYAIKIAFQVEHAGDPVGPGWKTILVLCCDKSSKEVKTSFSMLNILMSARDSYNLCDNDRYVLRRHFVPKSPVWRVPSFSRGSQLEVGAALHSTIHRATWNFVVSGPRFYTSMPYNDASLESSFCARDPEFSLICLLNAVTKGSQCHTGFERDAVVGIVAIGLLECKSGCSGSFLFTEE